MCAWGHELSGENVYIRRDGRGRQCKACSLRRTRELRVHKRSFEQRLHDGHLPARIVDYLFLDSGWLTAEGIALVLIAKPESVKRSLLRLRGMGFVESRQVGLATGVRGHIESRVEWAALAHPPTLF